MRILYFSVIASLFLSIGISCASYAGSKDNNVAFEYRDIYLPEYSLQDSKRLNLDFIDEEWGIWGHNLANAIPEDASEEIYAKSGGDVDEDQFCFSSEKLFDYVTSHIRNKYLLSDSIRFAIFPNDNGVVCLCSECVRLGNKPGNASPAVNNFINKLAKKYPEHMFFTSHYSTTKEPPAQKMPSNAGVIISAMEYPITSADTPKELEFLDLISQWKEKTDRIYIWDYVMNFDDYFTPYPVFSAMQRRFKLYRDAGVTGVFLNGSGNDYSSFGLLKKRVLAALLENPDQDWEPVLRRYAKELYPVAGDDIADFMVLQEKMVQKNGKKLPLYEGINTALKTYLPADEFVKFYNKIVHHKKVASKAELDNLELMTDAMALTMLELKRVDNDFTNTAKLKERLGRLPQRGIQFYNEGAWSISQYLKEFNEIEDNAAKTAGKNLLKGVKLSPITALDEDYQDVTILTDGLLGMPSNYHNGNLITSADPEFKISIPRQAGMKKLRVWLVNNRGFKIGLPESAYVTVNGVRRAPQTPQTPPEGTGHAFLDFDVAGEGNIVLVLSKNPDIKTMAIDEIEAF